MGYSDCWMQYKTLLFFCCAVFLISACAQPFEPQKQAYLPENVFSAGDLNIKFLGVSNIYIDDGEDQILFDAFLSRNGLCSIFSGLQTKQDRVLSSLEQADITHVSALFVAHAHYDHALDAHYIAKVTNAHIYASEYTQQAISHPTASAIKNGDTIRLGQFSVHVIDTPHVAKSWHIRWAEKFYLWLANGQQFADIDSNFSFFVEHPRGNLLIVPSAGIPVDAFRDIKIDAVFLSVGLLSHQSSAYIQNYWQTMVKDTYAKLVVPIHWDDFSQAIDARGLQPPAILIDNVAIPMRRFNQYASADDGVMIKFLRPYKNVNLSEFLSQ